jgi:hypothetical protein
LKTLGESLAEPHKANSLTNRIRRITDRFSARKLMPAAYNRRQRNLYKRRLPQRVHNVHPGVKKSEKRVAVPKRRQVGRLRQR